MPLPPPLTALDHLDAQLAASGYAVLDAPALARLAGIDQGVWSAWAPLWDALPPDRHLKDGGRYRRRRHGCFIVESGPPPLPPPRLQPHRAHWQPLAYNALHGGIERWFEPLPDALVADPAWSALLQALAGVAARLHAEPAARWFVEAHPFRIDTTDGIGRPTPEGAHRDGVDLVAVILLARQGIKGGETRVFDAHGPQGLRFTLEQPGSVLLLDDARVIHESTPIQPLDAAVGGSSAHAGEIGSDAAGRGGHRDTLVLTFRRGGFQGPEDAA